MHDVCAEHVEGRTARPACNAQHNALHGMPQQQRRCGTSLEQVAICHDTLQQVVG